MHCPRSGLWWWCGGMGASIRRATAALSALSLSLFFPPSKPHPPFVRYVHWLQVSFRFLFIVALFNTTTKSRNLYCSELARCPLLPIHTNTYYYFNHYLLDFCRWSTSCLLVTISVDAVYCTTRLSSRQFYNLYTTTCNIAYIHGLVPTSTSHSNLPK